MQDAERLYLERRAEDELDRAQQAEHPAAIRAHYELLGAYLHRLFPDETIRALYQVSSLQ